MLSLAAGRYSCFKGGRCTQHQDQNQIWVRYVMVQNLVPSIREAADWDVLIGHYLGVDHVGHTYDVHSPHMAAKLQQMNQHVEQVRCGDSTAPLCLCTGTDPSRGQ